MAKNGNGRNITLSNGQELYIDLSSLTWEDVKNAIGVGRFDKKNEAFLCRATGLTIEELSALKWVDARKVEEAVWGYINNPVEADPN